MHNGTVTIINPITAQLEIEIAHGLTAEARKRGKYEVGEGITGRVVANGAPIVVPSISNKNEAQSAVEAMKYHPMGKRGVSPFTRAAGYNGVGVANRTKIANNWTLSVLIIEK